MQPAGRNNLLDSAAAFLADFVPPCIYGLCQVCGAEATGIHYAASTCEGCKGFFKRSLPVYRSYKCFFGGDCRIIPETRGRCKSCRFQKCLQAGMSPEGNRNRGRGGRVSARTHGNASTILSATRGEKTLHGGRYAYSVPKSSAESENSCSISDKSVAPPLSSASFSVMPIAECVISNQGNHLNQFMLNRQRHLQGIPSRLASGSGSGSALIASSLSPLPTNSGHFTTYNNVSTPSPSPSAASMFNFAVSPQHLHPHSMHNQRLSLQQEHSPPVVIASGQVSHYSSPMSAITPKSEQLSALSAANTTELSIYHPPGLQHDYDASDSRKTENSNVLSSDYSSSAEQLSPSADPTDGNVALCQKIGQLINRFDSVVCDSIVCHLYTEWANQWMPNLLTARYNKQYLNGLLLYQPVADISHYMTAFMKAVTDYDAEMEQYSLAIPGAKALPDHVSNACRSHSCLGTFCVTFCDVIAEDESYYAFKCDDGQHSHWLTQTNYWLAILAPAGALPIFWHVTAYLRQLGLNDAVRALVAAAIIARPRGSDELPTFVRSALPVTFFKHFTVKPSDWASAEQVFAFVLNTILTHVTREYPERHEFIARNLQHFFKELAVKLDVMDELMFQSIPFGFDGDGMFDWQRLHRFSSCEDIIPVQVRGWLMEGWQVI